MAKDRIRQQFMVRNPEWKDEDWDICECGDYRHQHENGVGKCFECLMVNDLCHGFKPCLEFRRSYHNETESDPLYKREQASQPRG